jgi:hypothetical protein
MRGNVDSFEHDRSPLARGLLARPLNETSKRAKSDGSVEFLSY